MSRVAEERNLFRPEVIRYHSRRPAEGEIRTGTMRVALWAAPFVALAGIYGSFLFLSYQPKLSGRLTVGEALTGSVEVCERAGWLRNNLEPAEQVRVRTGGGRPELAARVAAVQPGRAGCANVQLTALEPAAAPAAYDGVELLLSPRRLVRR